MENDIDIKIKMKSGSLLANADLYIKTASFGYVTIKNFMIWHSNLYNKRLNDYANIVPPSYRSSAKYINLVFFEPVKEWEKLELLIWKAYLLKRDESVPIDPYAVDKAFNTT